MLKQNRQRRHKTIRRNLAGQLDQPRLTVFRSSQHIYAQLVDDSSQKTLVAASDLKLTGPKLAKAQLVGESLAKLALAKKIKKVVFDRSGFRYHGRVAALATGARKGGLEF